MCKAAVMPLSRHGHGGDHVLQAECMLPTQHLVERLMADEWESEAQMTEHGGATKAVHTVLVVKDLARGWPVQVQVQVGCTAYFPL